MDKIYLLIIIALWAVIAVCLWQNNKHIEQITILQQEKLALETARQADHAAFDALQKAEREARQDAQNRQKLLDSIVNAAGSDSFLESLRMFGKAVCDYEPASGQLVCAGSNTASPARPAKGADSGAMVNGGGKADK